MVYNESANTRGSYENFLFVLGHVWSSDCLADFFCSAVVLFMSDSSREYYRWSEKYEVFKKDFEKLELDADHKQCCIEAIRVMLESGRSIDACWQFMEDRHYTTKYIGTIIMEAKRRLV